MKVAILGFGIEGQSAAKYWSAKGNEITVCDANPDLHVPEGYQSKLGKDYRENLENYDLIVRSQSVRYDGGGEVTSVIREFFAECPATIIGVTGTKGKGTTSSLIAKILEAAGMPHYLAGNIGKSPLDLLPSIVPTDTVVLELSSTQLIDLDYSPHIAVCLMIAVDHQDWHMDMDEYISSKGNIFRHQAETDLAIAKAGDAKSEAIAALSPGRQMRYGLAPSAYVEGDHIMIEDGVEIMPLSEVAMVGKHNLENVCAAITATYEYTGKNVAAIRKAVASFSGLEHRLEHVADIEGVSYYDDSFSTNPDTAIAAIKAFAQDKVIILGGSSKKAEFTELAEAVEDNGVIHALLIGEEAAQIADALKKIGFTHFTQVQWIDMANLVYTAYQITEPGDVILLSPACASFDLFKNYKERGDQFKTAVLQLKETLNANQS